MIPTSVFGWKATNDEGSKIRLDEIWGPLADYGISYSSNPIITAPVYTQDRNIVVAQRFSEPDSGWWRARFERGAINVMELDDALWFIEDTWPGSTAKEVYNNPEALEHFAENCANSHFGVTSCEALKVAWHEFLGTTDEDFMIHVVPNRVPDIYPLREVKMPMGRPKKNPEIPRITIGYPAGPSHYHDTDVVGRAVANVVEGSPNVRFRAIGWQESCERLRIQDRHLCEKWGQLDYHEHLKVNFDFDIVIGPLAPTPFNACRSDIKWREAAAHGIPGVWSDWGPYPETVEDGKTGFLAETEGEWYEYLLWLVHDRRLRKDMGLAAWEQCRLDGTFADGVHSLLRIVTDL